MASFYDRGAEARIGGRTDSRERAQPNVVCNFTGLSCRGLFADVLRFFFLVPALISSTDSVQCATSTTYTVQSR